MTSGKFENHWNEIELAMPAIDNCEIPRKLFNVDVFKKLFEDAINYLSDSSKFNSEVEQISRFIFLGREAYRMLRGFQEMKKTQQAALRFQRINIVEILESFNSYIVDDLKSNVKIPYRQNLDFVLLKLQGLSKLFIRIVTCARKSARYFLGFIKAGSFYTKGTVFVASLAKLWDISRSMCKFTVTLYNSLISYRDHLKISTTINWVANNCLLPAKLDDWLGDEFNQYIANESYDFKMLQSEEEIKNFRENCGTFDFFEDMKEPDVKEFTTNFQEIKIESQDEIEDFQPISRKAIKVENCDYTHSLTSLTSKENVKLFLKNEDKLRKLNAQNSLTIKKVDKKVWKSFKSDLNTKLVLMQESALIDYVQDHLNDFLQ